jgi:hypothetical protein
MLTILRFRYKESIWANHLKMEVESAPETSYIHNTGLHKKMGNVKRINDCQTLRKSRLWLIITHYAGISMEGEKIHENIQTRLAGHRLGFTLAQLHCESDSIHCRNSLGCARTGH